jgi:integrase
MSYLQRRGAVYRFRRGVPARLRLILGKREMAFSLKTKDEREAKRWATAKSADVDRAFAEAEAALSNPAVRVYKALPQDSQERQEHPRGLPDEEAEFLAITDALKKLEGARSKEAATQRAILEALLKRVSTGDVGAEDNPPLSILFDRWKAERRPPAKTWLEWDGVRRRFVETIGGDLPVRAVTKAHVRAFKNALLSGKSKRTGKPASAATVQKLLNALRSVLSWAVKQGYLDVNPAAGITQVATQANPEDRRLPYSTEDLRKLFAVPRKPGVDHWLPWLALYTGARLEELGKLRPQDVLQDDGVSYLDITGKLKTKSSRRRVPLHPELVRGGFLAFVEEQRDAGHERLFPELRATSYGSLTAAWSKYWGRHSRELGLTDKRKTFHSFRHAFKDACRRAGLSEEIHDALTGHANGGVGRAYGLGVPLERLAEAVSKIGYSVTVEAVMKSVSAGATQ